MLEIVPGNYLTVTPYGAWRAVARADDSAERRILLAILREATSPELTLAAASAWTGEADAEAARQAGDGEGSGLGRRGLDDPVTGEQGDRERGGQHG